MTTYIEAVKEVEGLGFTVLRSNNDYTVSLIVAIYSNGEQELMGKLYTSNMLDGE